MIWFYKFLLFSFFIIFSNTILFSQTIFKPTIECYLNNDSKNQFSGQNSDNLFVNACFFVENGEFSHDSIQIKIIPNSLPNGYTLDDFEIEWKIEGVGFYETKSLNFKPSTPGGYFVNLFLISKDKAYSGTSSCKIRYSSAPSFDVFKSLPDTLCMDKTILIPFKKTDGTNSDDPIFLKKQSFNLGGLNKVLTDLPDGSGVVYETTINVDDYGTNSIIKSMNDINQICITMEHASLYDLEMKLECPNGKSIVLFNSFSGSDGMIPGGFSGRDVGIGNYIDGDGSTQGNPSWQYCFSSGKTSFGSMGDEYLLKNIVINDYSNPSMNPKGVYKPESTFDKFIGCPVKGEWKIKVKDNAEGDAGYIFNWGILFNAESFPFLESYQNKITSQGWVSDAAIVETDTSFNLTPKILGKNEYTYKITSDFGCVFDTIVKINTKLCLTIPNIVSLNSKTGNDKFFVNTGDVKKFSLEIFNRWGNSIFSTSDLHNAWDGKSKSGKVEEEGNYYYVVKLEYNNGEKYVKNGTFLLLH